jgi:predicted Zn-dependent protease
MIDGLVYGEDPKQGYVENGYFYHPEMKFQFPVPNGWQLVNSPTQVQIAPKDGKALIVMSLSPEKTLSAAQRSAIETDKLQVISSRNMKVNGFSAMETVADLNEKVRLMMYLIEYNGLIYKFAGLAEKPNFNGYTRRFEDVFNQFKKLTDQSKINRQPERIRIKTVNKTASFRNVMSAFKMPTDRHEELAILNGMELNTRVNKGTLIKVVEK